MKAAVVRYVRARVDGGGTLSTLARELGIPIITLRHWLGERAEFRQVGLVVTPASEIVLHAPRGVHVTGLDLEGLAVLLRRLA